MKKRIVVLGMGGTVAGQADLASDNIAYTAGDLDIESIFKSIPVGDFASYQVDTEQVAHIDSKDMSLSLLHLLSQKVHTLLCCVDIVGVVITHGTDTLEETAFFLQEVCNPSKPVVLTCAMRPATSFAPDGPQNILDALTVASCRDVAGVFVVCAGRIHLASRVQKNHPYRLDAFTSGEAGCYGFVEEGRARFLAHTYGVAAKREGKSQKILKWPVSEINWPRVEILMNFVGASGFTVNALISQGVDGIVIAGTGNGTIHHLLQNALLKAQSLGIAIVISSRCAEGRVLPVPGQPFVDSKGLTPVKTRIALILKLVEQ